MRCKSGKAGRSLLKHKRNLRGRHSQAWANSLFRNLLTSTPNPQPGCCPWVMMRMHFCLASRVMQSLLLFSVSPQVPLAMATCIFIEQWCCICSKLGHWPPTGPTSYVRAMLITLLHPWKVGPGSVSNHRTSNEHSRVTGWRSIPFQMDQETYRLIC